MKSKFFTTEHGRISSMEGLHCITVKSLGLKDRADITVYCPEVVTPSMPVVILLHGVYGSHWSWSLSGKIHITAAQMVENKEIKPLLLVMPSDGLYRDGSGYLPHNDKDYEKWIVEDVLQVIKEQFDCVTADSQFFIAGLSMGGFGALRLGAKYPNLFRAFSGLSSITDFQQMKNFVEDMDDLKKNVLVQDGVLEWMVKNKQSLKPFRFDCGLDDLLISFNRELHKRLLEYNIQHVYEEFPGGHTWDYWSTHIRRTLIFFDRNA